MYLFMHSFVDEHLGCFYILALVHNAAVNIGMNKTFKLVFHFFRHTPNSGTVVLICISLVIKNVELFFFLFACWQSVCPISKTLCQIFSFLLV